MPDIDKDNLLYRPEMGPNKNYRSDAKFAQDNLTPLPPNEGTIELDETPKRLKVDLEEVSTLLKEIPHVAFIGDAVVNKLIERIDVAYPEGVTPESYPQNQPITYEPPVIKGPNISHIGHIPQSSNPALSKLPDLFPKTTTIALTLETPKTLVQLIQEGYSKDQIQLDQYYLQHLQIIMQKYFQQMLAIMADTGLSDINDLTEDFDGEYVKVPGGKDLEHLRDYISRSQVIRKQKMSLFRKTHCTDKTLSHMRAWHAAAKQRERYYGENYKDSGTYTESHSNALLRESRSIYDKSYSSALYNMYKYLNSSVVMTNDVLNMTIKEAQAKAMLLKEGVDVFAKEPLQLHGEAGGIAGNSGQAGDGSGSGFDSGAASAVNADAGANPEDGGNTTAAPSDSPQPDTATAPSTPQPTNDIPFPTSGGGIFGGVIGNSGNSNIPFPTPGGGIFGGVVQDKTNGASKDLVSSITEPLEQINSLGNNIASLFKPSKEAEEAREERNKTLQGMKEEFNSLSNQLKEVKDRLKQAYSEADKKLYDEIVGKQNELVRRYKNLK